MPIYEYRRKSDGKIIEILQKASDEPLTTCPETGEPVEKIISRTNFQLKGSGWYATDYKDSGKPPEKNKEIEKNTEKKTESQDQPGKKEEASSGENKKDTTSTEASSSKVESSGQNNK